MIDEVLRTIEQLQGALFQGAVEPALYHLGLIDWSEDLYDGIGFAMFGAVEIALAFLLLPPIGAMIDGYLRFQGYIPPALEKMIPVLAGWPLLTFLLYVVAIDFG